MGDQTKFRATGTGDDLSQRIAAARTDTAATEPLIALRGSVATLERRSPRRSRALEAGGKRG